MGSSETKRLVVKYKTASALYYRAVSEAAQHSGTAHELETLQNAVKAARAEFERTKLALDEFRKKNPATQI